MRKALFYLLIFSVLIYALDVMGEENDDKSSSPAPSDKSTLVTIETKVTGSQEQPKVLYIMPWQGVTAPISVQGKNMHLALPQFSPIHPETFKNETRAFAVSQSSSINVKTN